MKIVISLLMMSYPMLYANESLNIMNVESLNKKAKLNKVDYPTLSASYSLVYNSSTGRRDLLVSLTNTGADSVDVVRSRMFLDESYVFEYEGKKISYSFKNHQLLEAIDREREKIGKKVINIPAKKNISIYVRSFKVGYVIGEKV